MAFDKITRNRLAGFVADGRDVIADEFTEQFQSLYGISAKGDIAPLKNLGHLDEAGMATAALLRERIEYLVRSHPDDKDGIKAAVARLAREQAFTVLNRLAAIRMAEKRGLIVESVGRGYQSKGFKVFETVAGSVLGDIFHRYRRYLFCLFDELAIDLGILFDRRSPQALLFPRESALLALLDLLNAADLDPLWAEDETIGWIYQYYNDPEERKKMRKESAAPRNSRELAVRNQFFTPRYVVEFLTDNTLGRIWYEMTRGQTRLTEQCRYLVRRPSEIFLAKGETAPETPGQELLSQEELLKQTVHILHRPLKDPREIRLLDPACGSMHFGLYAFDLFETIYEEAWDNGSCPVLQEGYASKDQFLKDVPRLIIEHNIHGIDIDARATQIAALSLWLRAQKAWQQQKVPAADRPGVRRSNIVCAEPMPGSAEMLEEFVATLDPPLLGELVKTVFDKMQLAGEAGYLLKIEEEIRAAIDTARKEWLKQQGDLFSSKEGSQEEFFDTAEQEVIDALRAYAEQADADSYQRRLFADDAARGFAFIDLCRKRYEAVVMNPPFGVATPVVFAQMKKKMPDTYTELYASFVDQGLNMAGSSGRVGAITSRAFLYIGRLEGFRKKKIQARIDAMLDLAANVMDDAFVEACAYTISAGAETSSIVAFDARKCEQRERLFESIRELVPSIDAELFVSPWSRLRKLPANKILYYLPAKLCALLESKALFEPEIGTTRQGMGTFNDFRFVHLLWEIPPHEIGKGKYWEPLAKGGPFSKYYGQIHLAVNWWKDGGELCEVNRSRNGQTAQVRQASDYWRLGGCTYSKRSVKGFSARALPKGCIMAGKGPAVISQSKNTERYFLGWLNSRLITGLIQLQANAAEFNTGILKALPWVQPDADHHDRIDEISYAMALCARALKRLDETDQYFVFSPEPDGHLSSQIQAVYVEQEKLTDELNSGEERITQSIDDLYEVDSTPLAEKQDDEEVEDEEEADVPGSSELERVYVEFLISGLIGTAFGRWDIRYATGARQPPELPDPFGPLPVCPPGMLQNAEGLPAEPKDVPADYPLRISWPGIMVDNENHPEDIVARVREAIEVIWKDRAEAIEQEACGILGAKTLRDYFRRPAAFFADHLKRYSKSRRQAPIYWPLSTKSGSYTLWLYYHRLTDQTLHTCLADFLDPKLRKVQSELDALAGSGGGATRAGELREFIDELKDLRDEIECAIKLPWKPNLNDGVLITASPLHKLFRLPKWQKELKACWDKLAKGDYDWAHLAYTIWPGRVEKACEKDRSIAIAHGLERLCKIQSPKPKKKQGKKVTADDAADEELALTEED